jgi:hypothetical protein
MVDTRIACWAGGPGALEQGRQLRPDRQPEQVVIALAQRHVDRLQPVVGGRAGLEHGQGHHAIEVGECARERVDPDARVWNGASEFGATLRGSIAGARSGAASITSLGPASPISPPYNSEQAPGLMPDMQGDPTSPGPARAIRPQTLGLSAGHPEVVA